MEAKSAVEVEVVYARADEQVVLALRLPCGANVRDAIRASGLMGRLAELAELGSVGIHGRIVALDTELECGDRVEIYRPLAVDPKLARRRRAAVKPT